MPTTTHPGVYLEDNPDVPPRITGVNTSITAFIGYTSKGPVNKAVLIHSWADYERKFGKLNKNSYVSYAISQFFQNGGTDSYVIRVIGKVNKRIPDGKDIIGDYENKTGIYALRDVGIFSIMAIPQTVALSDKDAQEVICRAIGFCEEERAFYLVDYNPACNIESINAWVAKLGSQKNAAVFFPRLLVYDPLDQSQLIEQPASGTIAGLFARIDATRGVFKSPAGLEAVLHGVERLSLKINNKQNSDLNKQGINCLRYFSNLGNVCWGARTLEGMDALNSEWKYIPVRRLALFIEESISRGLQWVVFEPSDEPLWSKIRLSVNDFLVQLWKSGAFQGTTPQQGFFVKCDKETTTQSDMNKGIVNVFAGFAPLKPSEFYVLSFQLHGMH